MPGPATLRLLRGLVPLALLLPLAAAVGGDEASSGQLLLDVGAAAMLVWLAVGLVVTGALLWMWLPTRSGLRGGATGVAPKRRLTHTVILLAAFAGMVLFFGQRRGQPGGEAAESAPAPTVDEFLEDTEEDPQEPRRPLVAGVLVGAGVAAGVAVGLRRRSEPPDPTGDAAAEPDDVSPLARVAAVSIEALEGEADPRRAVIAAYEAMERLLAGEGVARHPWETPHEHLNRALVTLGAAAPVATELVERFEAARFSPAPVTEIDRSVALDRLRQLRDGLVGSAR